MFEIQTLLQTCDCPWKASRSWTVEEADPSRTLWSFATFTILHVKILHWEFSTKEWKIAYYASSTIGVGDAHCHFVSMPLCLLSSAFFGLGSSVFGLFGLKGSRSTAMFKLLIISIVRFSTSDLIRADELPMNWWWFVMIVLWPASAGLFNNRAKCLKLI